MLLLIDTSDRYPTVAWGSSAGIAAVSSGQSLRVNGHIRYVMSACGACWQDISQVVYVVGPGSFTGLKVGLAAVKGWSMVRPVAVNAISSLHMYAQTRVAEQGVLTVTRSAGSQRYYAGRYEYHQWTGIMRQIGPDRCVAAQEIEKMNTDQVWHVEKCQPESAMQALYQLAMAHAPGPYPSARDIQNQYKQQPYRPK